MKFLSDQQRAELQARHKLGQGRRICDRIKAVLLHLAMFKIFFIIILILCYAETAQGMLAGGRPNAFSEGNNAFAGVVNPANAVWLKNRLDIGVFCVYQKSSYNNCENNPNFPLGKTDLTYKSRNIVTADVAIHKRFKLKIGAQDFDSSFTLAFYAVPTIIKLRTKIPFPLSGTSPIRVYNKTQVMSAVFSLKLNPSHSIGFTIDYLYFSHLRNGFQNSDNARRSVSPGHVTNKGIDHSGGIGCSLGWRWNITNRLSFGSAWTKKSYGGQYRKYRGYEPHHAKNFTPQTLGAGFSYRLHERLAGRLEIFWSNFGNLPNANNNVLSNGKLNLHKRGSKKSPGAGLQDATFINVGMGYQWNSTIALGVGFSHRVKLKNSSNILSHSYRLQTIYNVLSLGMHFKYEHHECFVVYSHGFKNHVSGYMPLELGGGKFKSEKENDSLSLSWGYKY